MVNMLITESRNRSHSVRHIEDVNSGATQTCDGIISKRVTKTCDEAHLMPSTKPLVLLDIMTIKGVWQRRRDSNPRDPSGPTPLAGERLRPLGHVSDDPSSGQMNWGQVNFREVV